MEYIGGIFFARLKKRAAKLNAYCVVLSPLVADAVGVFIGIGADKEMEKREEVD